MKTHAITVVAYNKCMEILIRCWHTFIVSRAYFEANNNDLY